MACQKTGRGRCLYIEIFLVTLYIIKGLLVLMNMCIYNAIAKSDTLPLDNKETPSIMLLSFASLFYILL